MLSEICISPSLWLCPHGFAGGKQCPPRSTRLPSPGQSLQLRWPSQVSVWSAPPTHEETRVGRMAAPGDTAALRPGEGRQTPGQDNPCRACPPCLRPFTIINIQDVMLSPWAWEELLLSRERSPAQPCQLPLPCPPQRHNKDSPAPRLPRLAQALRVHFPPGIPGDLFCLIQGVSPLSTKTLSAREGYSTARTIAGSGARLPGSHLTPTSCVALDKSRSFSVLPFCPLSNKDHNNTHVFLGLLGGFILRTVKLAYGEAPLNAADHTF